jgi:hypothetical protein
MMRSRKGLKQARLNVIPVAIVFSILARAFRTFPQLQSNLTFFKFAFYRMAAESAKTPSKQPAPFCHFFQLSADEKKWEEFEMVLGTADADHIHLTQDQANKLNLKVLPEQLQDKGKKTRFGYPAVRLQPIHVRVGVCSTTGQRTVETFEVKSVFLIPSKSVRSTGANMIWPSIFAKGVVGTMVLETLTVAFLGGQVALYKLS